MNVVNQKSFFDYPSTKIRQLKTIYQRKIDLNKRKQNMFKIRKSRGQCGNTGLVTLNDTKRMFIIFKYLYIVFFYQSLLSCHIYQVQINIQINSILSNVTDITSDYFCI